MIGTSLNRYDIVDELGQGGMSVVYRGRDTDLDRDVAIKVLHEHLASDPDNRERFRREAEAIARLEHPHILDVYDFSREEDEYSYIIMEYVPGGTLRQHVEAHGHPPPEVAALIGLAVADALEHAHDHGVIHRDLKPENIMVSEEGAIKLMDFGIAHVVDAETMTQTGNLLGSPAHMAPEIIDGREVNARSDIFSLGTVLYWLSTGSFPFHGDNPSHLLREVLECNYDAPAMVEPRLPGQLAEAIERCLSRDPDDRFESVEALAERLHASLDALERTDLEADAASYFRDPEGYTERFEEAIVEQLVTLGHQAMERDAIPEAMGYYDRVLAYEPDNEEVSGQIERLDRARTRRTWLVAIAVVLAVSGVGAGGYWYLAAVDRAERRLERVRRATVDARVHAERRAHKQHLADRARRLGAAAKGAARSTITSMRAVARARWRRLDAERIADAIQSSETPARPAAIASGRRDEPSPTRPAPPNEAPPPPPDAGRGAERATRSDAGTPTPATYTYTFKVLPLAATVSIDGTSMTAPRAARKGFEVTPGIHTLRVDSAGCHPEKRTFRVDGPQQGVPSMALEWKDARIRVHSNRPAVVYLNGDRSKPYPIGTDGQNASIRIPFGRADADRSNSRKQLKLEILPRNNLQLERQQSVVLRPGEQTSINVRFP